MLVYFVVSLDQEAGCGSYTLANSTCGCAAFVRRQVPGSNDGFRVCTEGVFPWLGCRAAQPSSRERPLSESDEFKEDEESLTS